MTVDEPDPRFVAALQTELQRRVDAGGRTTDRLPGARGDRPRARRQQLIGAVASIVVLALTAAVTTGLLQIRRDPDAGGRTPSIAVSPTPPATTTPPAPSSRCIRNPQPVPFSCGTYIATAATDAGRPRPGSLGITVTFTLVDRQLDLAVDTGCATATTPVSAYDGTITARRNLELQPHTCSAQADSGSAWAVGFFSHPLSYAVGSETLRLGSGSRTLLLRGSIPPFAAPDAPAAAPAPSAAALRRSFGSGCTSTIPRMPVTADRATIGDVDGDGRADTEWAVLQSGGTIEFGVTTASGITISSSAGFASGGGRAVSIGTLATGQTVALPTDQHAGLLSVLHACRWIQPKSVGSRSPFFFTTGYYDPPEYGGGCVGRRLYQVDSIQPSREHDTLIGVTLTIAPDGRTVTTGAEVTLVTDVDVNTSFATLERFGEAQCEGSKRLVP